MSIDHEGGPESAELEELYCNIQEQGMFAHLTLVGERFAAIVGDVTGLSEHGINSPQELEEMAVVELFRFGRIVGGDTPIEAVQRAYESWVIDRTLLAEPDLARMQP